CADQDPVGFDLPAAISGDNDVAIEGVSEQFPASDSLTLSYLSAPLQWDRQAWSSTESPDLEDYGPPQLDVTQTIRLHADNPLLPNAGGQVIISDCGASYVYNIIQKNPNPLWIQVTPENPNQTKTFYRPVHIYPTTLTANQYQVQAIPQGEEQSFALFKNGQLFVEGVENMQFLYGVRSSQGLRYSEQPPAQGNIVSVRLTLLMRTLERRYDLKEATRSSFELSPSITYSPQDNPAETGYRHRLFTSIIRIRNP
ncbi:MAG: PilW family protein, partial [Pseudomonadota bacterium]|nr:PilW family protein [Pseudomonadota bacterium]